MTSNEAELDPEHQHDPGRGTPAPAEDDAAMTLYDIAVMTLIAFAALC